MLLNHNLSCSVPDPRFAGASPQAQYEPDRSFDTVHIKLELDIDHEKKIIHGTATSSFRSINGSNILKLNAAGFKVSSVTDAKGKALKHKHGNGILEITTQKVEPGNEIAVVIKYKIHNPKLGVYFVGPDKHWPKKPIHIWSHSETEEAQYWFPVQDVPSDKATSEMILHVKKGFLAISNGILLSKTEKNNKEVFHWKMSKLHSPYLMNFVAGEFVEIKDSWKKIPVNYYCEKGREQETKNAFGKTPRMMEFFSNKIGFPYPYEKYHQMAVVDFIFGGMEHTTSTTMADSFLHESRIREEAKFRAEDVCAHELAHQWFGDLITCKDWSHGWLNESFATYFSALFTQFDSGDDEFLYQLYDNYNIYMSEDKDSYRRPIVTNMFKRSNDLFDRHLYEKGSLILNMIRNILGEKLWWAAIKKYVERNQNRAVETLDLIEAIREATGKNMKKFFDQWVFCAGHPEYKVLYHWNGKEAVVTISQMQKPDSPIYDMDMTFHFVTRNGVKNFTERVNGKKHTFKWRLDSEPVLFTADPDNFILKTMETIKPKKMWVYQLNFDPNVVGRITAAQELGKIGAVDELGKALHKEKFWGVQMEIAKALGVIRTEKAFDYLVEGLKIKHPRARRCAVAALGEFKDGKTVKHVKHFLDDKNSDLVPAESCITLGKSGDKSAEHMLKVMLGRNSWNDVIRTGSLEGLTLLKGEDAIDILKKYSLPGNFWRTRINALKNLALVGKGKRDVLDRLMECSKDTDFMVRFGTAMALGELMDERAVPVLEEMTKGHEDGRIIRSAEDSIKKIYSWLETDIETYRITEEVKKKMRRE